MLFCLLQPCAVLKYDWTNTTYVKITTNGCPNHLIQNAIARNPNSAYVFMSNKSWSVLSMYLPGGCPLRPLTLQLRSCNCGREIPRVPVFR